MEQAIGEVKVLIIGAERSCQHTLKEMEGLNTFIKRHQDQVAEFQKIYDNQLRMLESLKLALEVLEAQ